jgi:integrase
VANKVIQGVYPYPAQKSPTGTLYRAQYRSPTHRLIAKRGFATVDEAHRWLTTEKAKLITGDWIDPRKAKVTVATLAPAWLKLKEARLKPSAFRVLEGAWRNHVEPAWGSVPISRVVNSDVASWVAGIGKSPTVVHRAYGVLVGILDQAVRDGRIPRNTAANIESLPRRESVKKRRYLTPAELQAVAAHSGKHRALVLTLGYCGLRTGELIALRKEDIDLERRRINVYRNVVEHGQQFDEGTTKTLAGARLVPIPLIVSEALRERLDGLEDDALVFPSATGGYMSRVRASEGSKSWWKTALKAAGVPNMVMYDLRHTAASIAVSAGGSVLAVQRMLGHKRASMTLDVYADLFDDDLELLLGRIDAMTAAQNDVKMMSKLKEIPPST